MVKRAKRNRQPRIINNPTRATLPKKPEMPEEIQQLHERHYLSTHQFPLNGLGGAVLQGHGHMFNKTETETEIEADEAP